MKSASTYVVLTILILWLQGCQRDEVFNVPSVSTNVVSTITDSSSSCGGEILSDGNSPILMKGVCWSTSGMPTTNDFKTQDGTGLNKFTSNLTYLKQNTKYIVRAYATNKIGTGYGNEIQFTTLGKLPLIKTVEITEVFYFYAKCKCKIISDGGFPITSKGVCWSVNENPTINDFKNIEDADLDNFTSTLSSLKTNTTYYVRAFATNSLGTSYGISLSFLTKTPESLQDIDGNTYQTLQIGEQFWTVENLKVTHFANGDPITLVTDDNDWKTMSTEAYCYYDNNSANGALYGAIYNWFTVQDTRNLCPTGWHAPNDSEWSSLIAFLGGADVAGGKLKSTRTAPELEPRWNSPNTGATSLSGFSGLPGGFRDHNGKFGEKGAYGFWWFSNAFNPDQSGYQILRYNSALSDFAHLKKSYGLSVRCVKN